VKTTPERVEQRRIQRESSEDDSSRGSSKEESREGQVKKTSVEGRAKEAPGRAK
jgi:hypothetical protein